MTAWTLTIGCAVVLALPIVWRIRHRRFDPFEPIVLFAIAWTVMFVARPASMLLEGQRIFWGLDVFPTLPDALGLALLGGTAFVVGYELDGGRRLAGRLPRPRTLDTRVVGIGALVTAGLAFVAFTFLLPVDQGGDALRVLLGGRSAEYGEVLARSSAYEVYGSYVIAPSALIFTALALVTRRPLAFAAAGVTLALAFVSLLPMGARIVLIPLLGGIFVLAYAVRQARPRAVTLAVIAAAALLGSYFTLQFRDPNDDLTVRTAIGELGERPHAVLDPALHSADAEMVLALAAALTAIPEELPYRWGGATVGSVAARPVPREFWADKPLSPSQDLVQVVWPDLYPELNPAFSPLMGFYWDLWLVGVVVGMALAGLLWRSLYEWFLLHRTALGAQLVFASSLWFVVIGARNDLVDTLALAAFLVGPVLAVVAIASFRSEPAAIPIAAEREQAR